MGEVQPQESKAGTFEADKVQLFEELLALRSNEHTGGRKPKKHLL